MSTATGDNSGNKTVSAKVSEEFADKFDRTLMEAKLKEENGIDMQTSRAEAVRILMRKAIEDPELLEDT